MAPVTGYRALAVIDLKRISWRQLGSPRLTSIATPRAWPIAATTTLACAQIR